MEIKPKVAILGLGTMGQGMAANLLKAGFPLTIYNRTPAKADRLAALGARVAKTPAEAATRAAVVIAMLADDDASREAWLGPDGALAAMPPDGVVVESSTLSPAWIEELDAAAKVLGLRMVDAPVTGSRLQAEAGQLVFLAGTDADTLESIAPVLRSMSKEILHLGPVGSGAEMKLINNFLAAAQVTSFAQALAWIERSGLNRETAIEFLKRGAPGSGIIALMADRMTKRSYEVHFLLRLMAKDLRYASAAARARGVNLTAAETAEQLFRAAEKAGHGEQDMSAVIEILRKE
jgi:3-hydroxyisobutyrate dehydrogenase